MIELAKHIEKLLLDNDCVIVPELGGFIAHYQPARYEEGEGVFMPPYRSVGFNPQLMMNDGLLVQSYMQAHHTDYPDAVREIAQGVGALKDKLFQEGVVELSGVGSLYYTIRDTYEFHPELNGVLTPSLYALDSFLIKPLALEQVEEEIRPEFVEKKAPREFNMRWLNNAVAVAVAVILFFVLSVPVENTYVEKGNYASLGTECLFDAIRSQSMATTLSAEAKEPQRNKTHVTPVAVKVEKVAPAVVEAPKEEPKEEPKAAVVETKVEAKVETKVEAKVAPKAEVKKEVKAEAKKEAKVEAVKAEKKVAPVAKPAVAPKASKKNFHVIVASLPTLSDAERILKGYKQNGYSEATVVEGSGRFRIALYSFSDKASASKKQNELKQIDAFKDAWVLTSKN